MSLCPNVMTSASALGSSRVANGEPGTLGRRPRQGLAPRILTRSPVTGWQDIGKPTHAYFNTAGHISACFHTQQPSSTGKGPLPSCLPASPPGHARNGGASGRGLRAGAQAQPPLSTPGLGTPDSQEPGGATSKVQNHTHSLLPAPLGQAAGQRAGSTGLKMGHRALLQACEPRPWHGDQSQGERAQQTKLLEACLLTSTKRPSGLPGRPARSGPRGCPTVHTAGGDSQHIPCFSPG